MATQAQYDAGFAKAKQLAMQLVQQKFPFFAGQAETEIDQEGPALVKQIIDAAFAVK